MPGRRGGKIGSYEISKRERGMNDRERVRVSEKKKNKRGGVSGRDIEKQESERGKLMKRER
jgi:hypothetical protein